MEGYLLTNVVVSMFVFLSFIALKNAPARLRFYLLLMALFSWLVPWQQMAINVPVAQTVSAELQGYSQEVFSIFTLDNETNTNNVALKLADQNQMKNSDELPVITWFASVNLSLEKLFIFSFLMGLTLFIKDIYLYRRQVNFWLKNSTPLTGLYEKHQIKIKNNEQHIPICLVKGSGPGMATGIFKPTIWLADYQYDTQHSKTIITHELNHIRQHDPLWMWLITLSQRLLWWNPFVYYLAELAREQIELSCDEKCDQELNIDYAFELADIVLTTHTKTNKREQTLSPILGIKRSNNFNIKRLKRLTRKHQMKIKYLVVAAVTLTLSAFSALAINSSHDIHSANQKHPDESSVKKNIRGKMSIYTNDAIYNQLVDEILVIANQAKSKDLAVLENIFNELYQWHLNREELSKRSEKRLKTLEFTMFNYLLEALERHEDIISLYAEVFPEEPVPVKFFRHHLARAYSNTGQTEKAVELMAGFAQKQELRHRVGSLSVLSYVYLQGQDYENTIKTADEILALSPGESIEFANLSVKYHAYNQLGESQLANEVKELIANNFKKEPRIIVLKSKSYSPILDHVPDVI